MKAHAIALACIVCFAGCAFHKMPDTQSPDFWKQRDARMAGW